MTTSLKSPPRCADHPVKDLPACFEVAFGRKLDGELSRPLCSCMASGLERSVALDLRGQFGTGFTRELVEARRHPRYRLEVDIRVYPRNAGVVRGHTVDMSESGISAMLRVEVPIGEVVRLEFNLPLGPVEIHALVRQRNAFRYGLQFVDSSTAQEVIGRTCRQLAMEESLRVAKLP